MLAYDCIMRGLIVAKKPADREKDIAGRKAAIAAARWMLPNHKSQEQAAEQFGSNKQSVSNALLILNFGTEEEIAGVEGGTIPLDPTADAIRARTTYVERKAKRRAPTQNESMLLERGFDSEIYQKLSAALDNITGLPSPKDTAAIVRKNQVRVENVNRRILTALEWIQEFSNEITS